MQKCLGCQIIVLSLQCKTKLLTIKIFTIMATKKYYSVNYNSIVKETEKALLVELPAEWGYSGFKIINLWIPKSVVSEIKDKSLHIVDWFVAKTEREHASNGYEMTLDRISL